MFDKFFMDFIRLYTTNYIMHCIALSSISGSVPGLVFSVGDMLTEVNICTMNIDRITQLLS